MKKNKKLDIRFYKLTHKQESYVNELIFNSQIFKNKQQEIVSLVEQLCLYGNKSWVTDEEQEGYYATLDFIAFDIRNEIKEQVESIPTKSKSSMIAIDLVATKHKYDYITETLIKSSKKRLKRKM